MRYRPRRIVPSPSTPFDNNEISDSTQEILSHLFGSSNSRFFQPLSSNNNTSPQSEPPAFEWIMDEQPSEYDETELDQEDDKGDDKEEENDEKFSRYFPGGRRRAATP